jgi:hypothetical protein
MDMVASKFFYDARGVPRACRSNSRAMSTKPMIAAGCPLRSSRCVNGLYDRELAVRAVWIKRRFYMAKIERERVIRARICIV